MCWLSGGQVGVAVRESAELLLEMRSWVGVSGSLCCEEEWANGRVGEIGPMG